MQGNTSDTAFAVVAGRPVGNNEPSLSNKGKLKPKLFTRRALNINCSKIDNARKNSGKKDFKIRKSINKLTTYSLYPLWELNPYLCRERVMSEPLDEEDFFSTETYTLKKKN